jgi:ABC-type branched-subunit amino acid transport system substrate-binding protein
VRGPLLLAALLFISCTTAPIVTAPTPTPTREPNTLSVSVLLDLSGPRAPSGQPQRNAMQVWLDQNASARVKLRVKFVDVAGSDAKLLLELRRAVLDDRADAVVIGVPGSLDGPLGDAVRVASVPALFTLPIAEPFTTANGKFAFALAPTPELLARALAGDITERHIVAPMLIATDDTAPAATLRFSFSAELKRLGITPPTAVSLDEPDGARRVLNAAAVAKSVVMLCPTATHGDAIRAMSVSGAPLVYLSYLTEMADVTNLRDQSVIVTWPGARTIATPPSGLFPYQRPFVQTFTDRYGPPSTLAATAYDALGMLELAATQEASEPTGPTDVRVRMETGGYAGVVTRYAFTPQRHAGFSADDLVFMRWNAQRGAPFVPAAGPTPIQ